MGIGVEVSSVAVQVRLSPIGGVLAVKRRMEIPLDLVTGAAAMERRTVPPGNGTWLRAPGTHIPGLIRYGSYGRVPQREFWAVIRQRRVLVITVDDWDYCRVILGVRSPDSHAAAISAAVA